MNHQEASARLEAYIENKLSPKESLEFEVHLKSCDECKNNFFSLRSLLKKVEALPQKIEPPENLWEDIVAQIQENNSDKKRTEHGSKEVRKEKQTFIKNLFSKLLK